MRCFGAGPEDYLRHLHRAAAGAAADVKRESTEVSGYKRNKPTGRDALETANLPEVPIELLPDEVKRLGLDAFEKSTLAICGLATARVSADVFRTPMVFEVPGRTVRSLDAGLNHERSGHPELGLNIGKH